MLRIKIFKYEPIYGVDWKWYKLFSYEYKSGMFVKLLMIRTRNTIYSINITNWRLF